MKVFHAYRSMMPAVIALALGVPDDARAQAGAGRPNIVLIMSDDMGFSDLGCYGGEMRTPNLDGLAEGGLRFTQFYNTARCCPTRAALLTGLYSHQAGVGHMTQDRGFDAYRGDLNDRCATIAEVLRPAGYRNYAVGKWHVTKHTGPDGPKFNWPLQRGFDRYYGTIVGSGNFYHPNALTRDNTQVEAASDPDYRPARYYYTHAISDHAVRFLEDHNKNQGGQPFFMYVAYTAAHWPMHAFEEDIAKYRGNYDNGYDPIRQARFERVKSLGLIDPSWKLNPTVGDWAGVTNKEWERRCMEIYAAMIEQMDRGIGRIVAALRASGQLDNTLIFFLQDNGGCAEENGRADEAQLAKLPGGPDTFVAYGRKWANVSNTPFREYKHWVHEGGISTPLIVHWPVGIEAGRRGKLVKDPGHLIDIKATCVDLAGVPDPTRIGDRKVLPLEGVSLRPAFQGRPLGRTSPIFWEHEGNKAIRDGRWKLVAKEGQPWELYDMEADRTETSDLAPSKPAEVKQLAAAWDAWAQRVGAQPWDKVQPKTATPKKGAAKKKGNAAAKKKAASR